MQLSDTSRHMNDKLSRDRQYYFEGPNYVEAPTCTRVHNHPDPCHYCWTGGFNKDFKLRLEEYQSKLQDFRSKIIPLCANGQISHYQSCIGPDNKNNKEIADKSSSEKANVESDVIPCCSNGKINAETEEDNNEPESCVCETCNKTVLCPCPCKTQLGPELQSISGDKDGNILLRNVYQFKLPSCKHCKNTENYFAHSIAERHYLLNHGCSKKTPWLAKCRTRVDAPLNDNVVQNNDEGNIKERQEDVDTEEPSVTRNSWIFRDGNNLRRPCIADVLGNLNKTNAHKRYHDKHPDPVPDVRDNTRYSKRVHFYGYNSSVYR